MLCGDESIEELIELGYTKHLEGYDPETRTCHGINCHCERDYWGRYSCEIDDEESCDGEEEEDEDDYDEERSDDDSGEDSGEDSEEGGEADGGVDGVEGEEGSGVGPISDTQLSTLPREPLIKIQGSSGPRMCGICLEDLNLEDAVVVLPCQHWFGEGCITTWLKQRATCPTCRAVLDQTPNE